MKTIIAFAIIFIIGVSLFYLITSGMQRHQQSVEITLLKSAFFSSIVTAIVFLMYRKRTAVK